MTTTKQYDELNRLSTINSSSSSFSFSYQYNPANQRTKDTLADGSYWIYGYDSLGQVTNGCKFFANGTPVAGQQFDYAFDTIGNRTQTMSGGDTNGANLRVANYTNNTLNQIIGRDVPPYVDVMGASLLTNGVTVNGQTAYRNQEYFRQQLPANNAVSALWTNIVVSGGQNMTGNVYVAREPEVFSYDPDGNLTNDGRWAYTWDAENRLTGMTVNTNVGPQYQLPFVYDPKGRRIQKSVVSNSVALYTTDFLYDGWNLIAELSTSHSALRTYMWGSDLSGSMQGAGGVGGLLEVSYSGTNCFPAFDGNGNVAALVNAANGTIAANYEYGPFGEVIRQTGPMAKANPFRFSTKYDDDESDLLYYGYRYYKPSTGRWLSRDPSGEQGGLNVYGSSQNNPISFIDILGDLSYDVSDDLQSFQPNIKKKIHCGSLTLTRTWVDASNAKSLMSEDLAAYNDLLASLPSPPTTLNEAKIRTGSYLGSGFILRFDKSERCCCQKFKWVQKVSSPNGKAWKTDYSWESASGVNFCAADFPGDTFSGFFKHDWTWKFELTLYCVFNGTQLPLESINWSSEVIVKGLGETPFAEVKLNIDGF